MLGEVGEKRPPKTPCSYAYWGVLEGHSAVHSPNKKSRTTKEKKEKNDKNVSDECVWEREVLEMKRLEMGGGGI